jgi:hypothetical protein
LEGAERILKEESEHEPGNYERISNQEESNLVLVETGGGSTVGRETLFRRIRFWARVMGRGPEITPWMFFCLCE